MTPRHPNGRAAHSSSPGAHPEVAGVPLRVRSAGEPVSGQFLTRVPVTPGESRRDALARLSAWARRTEVAAAVLEDHAGQLYADARALGFDDAGPLPRYAARVRPGPVRRALTAVLLPGPRVLPSMEAVPEALPETVERALRERLAAEFGALSFLPGDLPQSGVHLVQGDQVVASCRFRLPVAEAGGTGGDLLVTHWIAPPGEPDLTARLALEALGAATQAGAAAAVFETTHRGLAKGLLLARFLPRRPRARVLVRQRGDRDLPAPSIGDWHLTTPTSAEDA